MPMKVLLLSGSKTHEKPEFLEHAFAWIKEHFGPKKRILYIPYALNNYEEYTGVITRAFAKVGIEVISAHTSENPVDLLEQVEGIYVGGGNTFRLLNKLYKTGLIPAILTKVREGMPYMGASAGTNMACPGIYTTNDMPIIKPPSLRAIGIINFQINPHYLDPDLISTHMGETREKRIGEFHEVWKTPVLGLREGSALSITDNHTILLGTKTARLFLHGLTPIEVEPGTDLAKKYDLSINKGTKTSQLLAINRGAKITSQLFKAFEDKDSQSVSPRPVRRIYSSL